MSEETKKLRDYHNKNLLGEHYRFNDNYGLCYLTFETYQSLLESLSYLRRIEDIDGYLFSKMKHIYKHYYNNSIKIKELDSLQPRFIAQKFIGKKNIRRFIFNRDLCCLRCGTTDSLTIDHIIPINKGGENKLMNLQTLCKRCNSSKSDKFKDYRNGSR